MAITINRPYGHKVRRGEIRKRSQVWNKKIGRYVERNTEDGRFLNVKSDSRRFKGVKRER